MNMGYHQLVLDNGPQFDAPEKNHPFVLLLLLVKIYLPWDVNYVNLCNQQTCGSVLIGAVLDGLLSFIVTQLYKRSND